MVGVVVGVLGVPLAPETGDVAADAAPSLRRPAPLANAVGGVQVTQARPQAPPESLGTVMVDTKTL